MAWSITDTKETIPTITHSKGQIIKTNNRYNKIYRITGPNCDILLSASNIKTTAMSPNKQFFYVWASRYYDIEAGLADHFDPYSFVIVYPYAVKYSGGLSSIKFTYEGLEIKNIWSNYLVPI